MLLVASLTVSSCTPDPHIRALNNAVAVCRQEIEAFSVVTSRRGNGIGSERYSQAAKRNEQARGPALMCLLRELDAPLDLQERVLRTNAVHGIRVSEWGHHRLVWSYSAQQGVIFGIGPRGATLNTRIDFTYP